ncbi:MAG: YeeE/YedE family protein [Candidatus Dactylopiibacterium sp.]|nr:YeeE/YedE family protein [Candidatus Dactylopiibacterium sp.]
MSVTPLPSPRFWLPALLVLCASLLLSRHLHAHAGASAGLSVLLGAAFGIVLQRSRFCFYCVSRDFIETRDARGLLGIVAALAVGTLGYHLLFGAFLPDPSGGRLPPGAHIGPVSGVLALGAFAFGLGMAIAGSCISAQLYRLGEGLLSAPVALLGAAIGFVLGFLSWNTLYLRSLQQAPVPWLPQHLGYDGSLLAQLALLTALALWLGRAHRPAAAAPAQPWWQRRWPTWAGGILIGALGAAAFLRVAPLGVTAELGSLARTAADGAGWLPARLEGLDTLRGCATVIKDTLWSNNGAFVAGLVLGAFAAALSAGDFRPRLPGAGELLRALGGGVLMGWGAMVGLGCTVGTLLSGIMAAAVSGWVFALFAGVGLYAGWWLRRRAPGR